MAAVSMRRTSEGPTLPIIGAGQAPILTIPDFMRFAPAGNPGDVELAEPETAMPG